MVRKCPINKKIKCGYHTCIPECKVLKDIGQQQLLPTKATTDMSIHHSSTEEYVSKKGKKLIVTKIEKKKGHTTIHYKVEK